MRFRTGLVVGLGLGYYFGAKAGRERYEQIEEWLDRLRDTGRLPGRPHQGRGRLREGTTALRTMVEETAFGGDRRPPVDLDDDAALPGRRLRANRPADIRSLFTDPTLNCHRRPVRRPTSPGAARRPDGRPRRAPLLAVEVVAELLAAVGVAQLGQRLGLDLADPLAGDAELLAHLLERAGLAVVEAEAQPHDLPARGR